MRPGNQLRLAWGVLLVVIATFTLAGGTVRGGGEDATPPRGQIVIKPTGRRVRVISVSASARTPAAQTQPPTQPQTQPRALVRPALMSLEPTTAPRVFRASFEEGLEFGEQSVRLPYGYDPRENPFYGSGPFLNYPLYTGYSVTPCYGGFGYGSVYGDADYRSSRFGHSRRYGSWSSCAR